MPGPRPFPVLRKDQLNERQRALWNELTQGPRGFYVGGPDAIALPDLYNAWLQFPELGTLMLGVADAIRAQPALTDRLRELVVLTTSVLLNCRIEYDFHSVFARQHGLSDAIIVAIGAGRTPSFDDPADRAVHAANVELVQTGGLAEATRSAVIAILGLPGLIQLIGAIGLYSVVAFTTNVAGVRLHDDFAADPQQLTRFFSSPAGD